MVGASPVDARERGSRAVRVAAGMHLFLGVAFGASVPVVPIRTVLALAGGRERPSTDCRGSRRMIGIRRR
jgi:hypothetical protein